MFETTQGTTVCTPPAEPPMQRLAGAVQFHKHQHRELAERLENHNAGLLKGITVLFGEEAATCAVKEYQGAQGPIVEIGELQTDSLLGAVWSAQEIAEQLIRHRMEEVKLGSFLLAKLYEGLGIK